MSWLFSQALVEEYSVDIFSDGEPSAQWNVMPTPQGFWRNDKMMDASRLSRFGPTLRLLTEQHGEAVLMLFLEDFPVRTYPSQEGGRGLKERVAGYGLSSVESLAKYDPISCSWKTPQLSLLEDSELYSETWPRWGSMRDGECWVQEPSVRYAKASVSGLSLLRPTAQCWKAWTFLRISSLIRKNHADGNVQEQSARCFHKMITAESNEILMKWPPKWTALEPLEMDKFHLWLQEHSLNCPGENKHE